MPRRDALSAAPYKQRKELCVKSAKWQEAACQRSLNWCSRGKLRQEPQLKIKEMTMKYMLTWTERSQGSPMEYENAQKRILEVFTQWKQPDNFKIEMFVIRVGDWGGYMLLDCDDPTAVHKFCSMLPAFVFEARPVIPIKDAVRVELEAISFRDGLKR
jgi:muconolactone delta-isomerase